MRQSPVRSFIALLAAILLLGQNVLLGYCLCDGSLFIGECGSCTTLADDHCCGGDDLPCDSDFVSLELDDFSTTRATEAPPATTEAALPEPHLPLVHTVEQDRSLAPSSLHDPPPSVDRLVLFSIYLI